MTLQNEQFEELIHQQLARELEPQRGRALAAFRAQIAAEAAERAAAQQAARAVAGGSRNPANWAQREVSPRALWLWTGVPSLIAAALAVAVTLHFIGPANSQNPVPSNNDALAATGSVPDNRVAVLDNTPMRPVEGVGSGGSLANDLVIRGVVVQPPRLVELRQPEVHPTQLEPSDHAFSLSGNANAQPQPDHP